MSTVTFDVFDDEPVAAAFPPPNRSCAMFVVPSAVITLFPKTIAAAPFPPPNALPVIVALCNVTSVSPDVIASFPPPYTFSVEELTITSVFTDFPPALFPPYTFVTVPEFMVTYVLETVPFSFEPPYIFVAVLPASDIDVLVTSAAFPPPNPFVTVPPVRLTFVAGVDAW